MNLFVMGKWLGRVVGQGLLDVEQVARLNFDPSWMPLGKSLEETDMLRGSHGDESLSGSSMVVDDYTAESLIRSVDVLPYY